MNFIQLFKGVPASLALFGELSLQLGNTSLAVGNRNLELRYTRASRLVSRIGILDKLLKLIGFGVNLRRNSKSVRTGNGDNWKRSHEESSAENNDGNSFRHLFA